MRSILICEKLFGPAYSELQFNYNGLISIYTKTGDDAKRREFEEKKREWMRLQREKKEGPSVEKEDDMPKMEFEEMLEFVKNTTDIETSPA